MAHRREAPIICGQVPGPPPVLTDDERGLLAAIVGDGLPPAPPARVDRELEDGDVLAFGGSAHVLAVPGHTDGSIALYLPRSGVLFTGDNITGGRTSRETHRSGRPPRPHPHRGRRLSADAVRG
jgi:glyoxylase-like metal-dependent hydrolase (beta-lactamase superfamily II)